MRFRGIGGKNDYALYFANRIYSPSYISLHTALAFYSMIPEAVVQFTSITSLKTASFTNDFGEYSYRNVKKGLMFGYELKPIADKRTIQLATPKRRCWIYYTCIRFTTMCRK